MLSNEEIKKIKHKKLFNKLCKIKNSLVDINKNDLQFQAEDQENKINLWSSIDRLNILIDNLK